MNLLHGLVDPKNTSSAIFHDCQPPELRNKSVTCLRWYSIESELYAAGGGISHSCLSGLQSLIVNMFSTCVCADFAPEASSPCFSTALHAGVKWYQVVVPEKLRHPCCARRVWLYLHVLLLHSYHSSQSSPLVLLLRTLGLVLVIRLVCKIPTGLVRRLKIGGIGKEKRLLCKMRLLKNADDGRGGAIV